jgi:hypothetical protein
MLNLTFLLNRYVKSFEPFLLPIISVRVVVKRGFIDNGLIGSISVSWDFICLEWKSSSDAF